MTRRTLKPCSAPACNVLLRGGTYCPKHAAEHSERRASQLRVANREYNKKRPESDSFYGQSKWRKLSAVFRQRHPLCCMCEAAGRVEPSRMVDHIKPRKTHPELSYEWSNLRALCWSCHNRYGEKVVMAVDKSK